MHRGFGRPQNQNYSQNHQQRNPCNFFQRNGWCRFGDNCRYSHGNDSGSGGSRASSSEGFNNTRNFTSPFANQPQLNSGFANASNSMSSGGSFSSPFGQQAPPQPQSKPQTFGMTGSSPALPFSSGIQFGRTAADKYQSSGFGKSSAQRESSPFGQLQQSAGTQSSPFGTPPVAQGGTANYSPFGSQASTSGQHGSSSAPIFGNKFGGGTSVGASPFSNGSVVSQNAQDTGNRLGIYKTWGEVKEAVSSNIPTWRLSCFGPETGETLVKGDRSQEEVRLEAYQMLSAGKPLSEQETLLADQVSQIESQKQTLMASSQPSNPQGQVKVPFGQSEPSQNTFGTTSFNLQSSGVGIRQSPQTDWNSNPSSGKPVTMSSQPRQAQALGNNSSGEIKQENVATPSKDTSSSNLSENRMHPEAMKAFTSPKFKLGYIPEIAPPTNLCN